jgi:hypothetical protein
MEENQGFVCGMEGSLQRSERRGDGEMAVFPGVADSDLEDQRRMKLCWRSPPLGQRQNVEAPGC